MVDRRAAAHGAPQGRLSGLSDSRRTQQQGYAPPSPGTQANTPSSSSPEPHRGRRPLAASCRGESGSRLLQGREQQLRGELTQTGNRSMQIVSAQRLQQLLEALRWMLQRSRLVLDNSKDCAGRQVNQVDDEGVRVYGFNAVCCQSRRGKVLQVEGDDGLSTDSNGCRENMPIVLVRQGQRRFQRFEVLDKNICNRRVHELTRSRQPRLIEFRTLEQDVSKDLVEDSLRRPRTNDRSLPKPNEQISKRCREQHASVVDDRECHRQYPRPNASASATRASAAAFRSSPSFSLNVTRSAIRTRR